MRLLVLLRRAFKVVLYLLPKFLSEVVSKFLLSHHIGIFLLTAVLLGLGVIWKSNLFLSYPCIYILKCLFGLGP